MSYRDSNDLEQKQSLSFPFSQMTENLLYRHSPYCSMN